MSDWFSLKYSVIFSLHYVSVRSLFLDITRVPIGLRHEGDMRSIVPCNEPGRRLSTNEIFSFSYLFSFYSLLKTYESRTRHFHAISPLQNTRIKRRNMPLMKLFFRYFSCNFLKHCNLLISHYLLKQVLPISLVKQVSFQISLSKSGHDYQPDPLIRTQPRHPGFRVTLHDMGIDEAFSAISRGQYNEIGPNADHLAYETAEDSIMQLSQVPAVAGKINSGNDVAPPSTGYRKLNQSIAYQGRPLSCLCFVLIYKFGLLLPVGVIQKISANLWC